MKVVCTFHIEVDGDVPAPDVIAAAFLDHIKFGVIPSEGYDGTDAWAIVINECEVQVQSD